MKKIFISIFVLAILFVFATNPAEADKYIGSQSSGSGCVQIWQGTDANGNPYYYTVDGGWTSYSYSETGAMGTYHRLCVGRGVVSQEDAGLSDEAILVNNLISTMHAFIIQSVADNK